MGMQEDAGGCSVFKLAAAKQAAARQAAAKPTIKLGIFNQYIFVDYEKNKDCEKGKIGKSLIGKYRKGQRRGGGGGQCHDFKSACSSNTFRVLQLFPP